MDERDWLIISTLHSCKSISKTAKTLYISQPALTERIKQIEDALGVTLLNRSNKGVTMTPQGEFAATFARKLLREVADFKAQLIDLGEEAAGVLKIAAPSIICRYYLPGILENFQKKYPKVKLDVGIQQSDQVLKMLKSRLIDFGVTKHYTGFSEDEKLFLLTYGVYAASMEPFKLEDLPKLKRVEYSYEPYYKKMLTDWWQDRFAEPPLIGSMVANLDLCKEMVFNGLGYGFLPEILISEAPGKLYTKLLQYKDGRPFMRDTFLVFNKEILKEPLPKLFYNYLLECNFASFLRPRNK